MNGQTKRTQLSIVIGLLAIASSQILSYYQMIPDVGRGVLVGLGIGLIIGSLMKRKPQRATAN